MLCIFATNGTKRYWNTLKPTHLEEVSLRGVNCFIDQDIELLLEFYKQNDTGLCEVKKDIKQILLPLIQEIKNKFPKNKI